MKSAGKNCTAKDALREEDDKQRKEGKPVLSPQEKQQHSAMPMRTMIQAKYVEPFDEDDHRSIDEARAKEIGRRIKELRKTFLLIASQEVFGKGIGVSRGAVANWEIGKGISRVNLYRVSEVYNISMVWLSTGKGNPRGRNTAQELPALIEQSGLDESEQEEFVDEIKALLGVRIRHRRPGGSRGNGPPNNNND